MKVSGVILAGGKSRRMGTNKAMLGLGQNTMLELVVKGMRQVAEEIIIVSSDPDPYLHLGLPVVQDILGGCGPLGGLHSGLHHAKNNFSFVAGCDMPFFSAPLARHMVSQSPGYDVVVPRQGEYLEPLFAIYGKGCLPFIEAKLNEGRFKIMGFFSLVRVKYVEGEDISSLAEPKRIFFNVNTPLEYQRAKEALECPKGRGC